MTNRLLPTHRAPTHPGEMFLEEFVKPLHLSLSEVARRLGVSFPRLHEVVTGKRSLTVDTALRIAAATGMSVGFWLQLQLDWDTWHIEHSRKPPEVLKIKRLAAAS